MLSGCWSIFIVTSIPWVVFFIKIKITVYVTRLLEPGLTKDSSSGYHTNHALLVIRHPASYDQSASFITFTTCPLPVRAEGLFKREICSIQPASSSAFQRKSMDSTTLPGQPTLWLTMRLHLLWSLMWQTRVPNWHCTSRSKTRADIVMVSTAGEWKHAVECTTLFVS